MALPDGFHSSDASYTCELQRTDGVAEIVLGGELDLAVRPRLDTVLRTALGVETIDALVVDLTAVTFADSTTLHWLTEAKRGADTAGVRLTVATAPGAVRDLLAITGIRPHLSV